MFHARTLRGRHRRTQPAICPGLRGCFRQRDRDDRARPVRRSARSEFRACRSSAPSGGKARPSLSNRSSSRLGLHSGMRPSSRRPSSSRSSSCAFFGISKMLALIVAPRQYVQPRMRRYSPDLRVVRASTILSTARSVANGRSVAPPTSTDLCRLPIRIYACPPIHLLRTGHGVVRS